MVSMPARPGSHHLRARPRSRRRSAARRSPSVTRTSASMNRRSTRAGTAEPGTDAQARHGRRGRPRHAGPPRTRPARSGPSIASSSWSVHARWLPVAISSRMCRPGSWSRSTGQDVRDGNGRVTSQMLTATVLPTGASSGSGRAGRRRSQGRPQRRLRVGERCTGARQEHVHAGRHRRSRGHRDQRRGGPWPGSPLRPPGRCGSDQRTVAGIAITRDFWPMTNHQASFTVSGCLVGIRAPPLSFVRRTPGSRTIAAPQWCHGWREKSIYQAPNYGRLASLRWSRTSPRRLGV